MATSYLHLLQLVSTVRQAGVSDDGFLGFRYALRLPAKACSPPSWSWPGLQSYTPLGGLPGLQVQDHQLITLPHRRSVLSYKIQTLFLEDVLLRSELSTGVTLIISFS